MLTVTRLDRPSILSDMPLTDVSDCHRDTCEAVGPKRPVTAGVYTEAPSFEPITVTLEVPVPATFACLRELSCVTSTENTFVVLETLTPTVIYVRSDDITSPGPARQPMDVSAVHKVDWHALCGILALAE